jgi:hypothetical protein
VAGAKFWAFALFAGWVAAQSPALADDQGWILTQKSLTLGDQYVYVSPAGVKVWNPNAEFAMVAHAPDWQITLYNQKSKIYYQTSIEKWKQDLASHGLNGQFGNASWNRAANSKICGLKATEFSMAGNTIKGKKGVAHKIDNATYWTSDDITVPPKLADLLATAYGLPPSANIPLKLSYTDSHGAKSLLDTYRAQAAPIPISYFDCPTGLTLAKSYSEVMMNDDQRQVLNDMARELSSDTNSPTTPTAASSQPMQRTASTTTSAGKTINVGGLNLDKDKVQKLLDSLGKGQH